METSLYRAKDGQIAAMQYVTLCSDCNIHSSGKLKTAVDMSAEEIVHMALFFVWNCKLETTFSVAGVFDVCRVLAVEFLGRSKS